MITYLIDNSRIKMIAEPDDEQEYYSVPKHS